MSEIGGPLARVLSRHRESLNARFELARRSFPQLDAAELFAHLRDVLDPIAHAVAAFSAEKTQPVVLDLYNLSLDLLGKQLLGPGARFSVVRDGWKRLLPQIPGLLAREPAQVAGAVTNALYNLATTSGARPEEWLEIMLALAGMIQTRQELLEAGRVAAWRAGMPALREIALSSAASLPIPLACGLLGLSTERSAEGFLQVLDRLRADRWLRPDAAVRETESAQSISLVATAGTFRGFGGDFLRPPTVQAHDGRLLVTDGNQQWRLAADVFGASLLRVPPAGMDQARASKKKALQDDGPSIDQQGMVRWDRQQSTLRVLSGASAFASDGQTLAVTLPTSHHVFLVARVNSKAVSSKK